MKPSPWVVPAVLVLSATLLADDKLSSEQWRMLIQRAAVWQPVDTQKLDLLAGPGGPKGFAFDGPVTCGYHYPDKRLSGVTPKFQCTLESGDVVKVKYGDRNGEVFAEVASSRLFWALGFLADSMYPVRVTCLNCPADPHKEGAAEWHLGKSGSVATRAYDPAAIERELAGEKMEGPDGEGWVWSELDAIDPAQGGATRAQVDALKLLAVFVQHVDSKREQQELLCMGNRTTGCKQPMMVVRDLGSTFGAARKLNYDKMKLDSWREVPIWKDKAVCQGHLTKSLVGTIEHPRISEAGRAFLAERLMQLSDRQIRDLFTAARVERRGDKTMDDRGGMRPVTVTDWMRAFKDKRAQIVDHRCDAS